MHFKGIYTFGVSVGIDVNAIILRVDSIDKFA